MGLLRPGLQFQNHRRMRLFIFLIQQAGVYETDAILFHLAIARAILHSRYWRCPDQLAQLIITRVRPLGPEFQCASAEHTEINPEATKTQAPRPDRIDTMTGAVNRSGGSSRFGRRASSAVSRASESEAPANP